MPKCDHLVVTMIGGYRDVCRLENLPVLLNYFLSVYWVGTGEPPESERQKYIKEITKLKYCPKCGEKLDFESVLK